MFFSLIDLRLRNSLAIVTLVAIVAACAGDDARPAPSPVTDAEMAGECADRVIVYGSPAGLPVLRALPQIDAYVVCTDGALTDAQADALEFAEPDTVRDWLPEPVEILPPSPAPADAGAQADAWSQWHLAKMRAEDAWGLSTGEGVTVYVLDTAGNCGAMQMTHCGQNRNYVGGSSSDGHGHGSHVGSTIGEALNGQRGVGTAHGVTVAFYKVLGDNGSGSTSGIAAAMTDAADACPTPGKCIISMSLGSSQRSTTLDRAAAYAISQGVPVIAAGGNHGTTAPGFPGCSPGVIGVGATDASDRAASFTARGSCIDVAAPGVSITASRPDGSPWTISGTSMATPNTSAVAALLLALGAQPSDIETLLESTADDIGGQQLGAGRINALAAVQAVSPGPRPTVTTAPDLPTPDKTEHPPSPVTAVPPAPTDVPGEPPKACEGRALLFDGAGFRIGAVLVPCEDGR